VTPFYGFTDETLFGVPLCLISPWMRNGNIMSFLRNNPNHDRLKAIFQIALGMRYLHEEDPPVVHGDLKGANILVDKHSNCRIADFGLSHFGQTMMPASSELAEKGTLRWLAPEILDYGRFKNATVAASDVYAFACTIIEIYTGQPPYSNIKKDPAVITAVVVTNEKPPRPPVEVLPSDELWALVMSCLSTDPEQRPHARNVVQVLGNISNWEFPSTNVPSECPYEIDDSSPSPEAPPEIVLDSSDEEPVLRLSGNMNIEKMRKYKT
ncbi:kinase-like protein, partial [Hymenopellis radicata]